MSSLASGTTYIWTSINSLRGQNPCKHFWSQFYLLPLSVTTMKLRIEQEKSRRTNARKDSWTHNHRTQNVVTARHKRAQRKWICMVYTKYQMFLFFQNVKMALSSCNKRVNHMCFCNHLKNIRYNRNQRWHRGESISMATTVERFNTFYRYGLSILSLGQISHAISSVRRHQTWQRIVSPYNSMHPIEFDKHTTFVHLSITIQLRLMVYHTRNLLVYINIDVFVTTWIMYTLFQMLTIKINQIFLEANPNTRHLVKL